MSTMSTMSQIELLKNMSELIRSVGEPAKLIRTIITKAVKVTNASDGALLIADPATERLFFHTATGSKDEDLEGIELGRGEGIAGWVLENRKPILSRDVTKDSRWSGSISKKTGIETTSIAAVPMTLREDIIGVLEIINVELPGTGDDEILSLVGTFADLAAVAISKSRLLNNFDRENLRLRKELDEKYKIIGNSRLLNLVLEDAKQVAASKATTILCGESGTGKELFARLIHSKSKRSRKPFMAVNCGVFPESLLERELFGHEKGAFTGADQKKTGLFESAQGGTLFLDEIGETTPLMQVKLLRVLQDGTFLRIGGTTLIQADARIIVATNRNIDEMVKNGEFRQDLFYRLNVVRINLPPLRKRIDDIPLLVQHFIEKKCAELGRPLKPITPEAMDLLKGHQWPGNIRELENSIERAVVMGRGDNIVVEDLPFNLVCKQTFKEPVEGITLKEGMNRFKKEFILRTLHHAGGSKNRAAEILGIQRTYLYRLFSELEIEA